jgi:hypothetical protein
VRIAAAHPHARSADIEKHITSNRGVPLVLLVVQGGPGTLSTILQYCEMGSPIVVLSNSGGAASAVTHYCTPGRRVATHPPGLLS